MVRRGVSGGRAWVLALSISLAGAVVLSACGVGSGTSSSRRSAAGGVSSPVSTATSSSSSVPGSTTTSSTTPAPTTTVAQQVTETIGVTTCPTALGASADPTRAPPATIAITLPTSAVGSLGSLNFYSDSEGLLVVLAPAGWSCSATVGGDGSAQISVVPATEAGDLAGGLTSPNDSEVIQADETSQCAGCTYDQVCGLFPVIQAQTSFNGPCGGTAVPPPQEVDASLSPSAVSFEDPPGVRGTGVLSGGANPVNGVMTYTPDSATSQPSALSYEASCAAPSAQHALCTAILNTFLTRYTGS